MRLLRPPFNSLVIKANNITLDPSFAFAQDGLFKEGKRLFPLITDISLLELTRTKYPVPSAEHHNPSNTIPSISFVTPIASPSSVLSIIPKHTS
jgi:hypothetical protein